MRWLGVFESAQALANEFSPYNAVGVLHLCGELSFQRLQHAFSSLQERHPLLGVSLKKKGSRFSFVDNATAVPVLEVARRDDEHWLEIVEHELNTAIDVEAGPLLRCTYLRPAPDSGHHCELILCFPHAVMDFSSGTFVCHELLQACAGLDLEQREPLSLEDLRPSEQYFPPAWSGFRGLINCAVYLVRQGADELRFQLTSLGKRRPPIHTATRCHVLCKRLEKERATHLIRRARRERISLNSVIAAAILLATHRHLYHSARQPLRHFTMADLRPYLRPPQPEHHLCSHFAMLRYTLPLRPDEDLWQLARRFNRQVHLSSKRGEKFAAVLTSKLMVKVMFSLKVARMSTTASIYGQPLDLAPRYGDLEVRGLNTFVSNHGLGPEFSAQVRLQNGELHLDMMYIDKDMSQQTAHTIADEMLTLLGEESRDVGNH